MNFEIVKERKTGDKIIKENLQREKRFQNARCGILIPLEISLVLGQFARSYDHPKVYKGLGHFLLEHPNIEYTLALVGLVWAGAEYYKFLNDPKVKDKALNSYYSNRKLYGERFATRIAKKQKDSFTKVRAVIRRWETFNDNFRSGKSVY